MRNDFIGTSIDGDHAACCNGSQNNNGNTINTAGNGCGCARQTRSGNSKGDNTRQNRSGSCGCGNTYQNRSGNSKGDSAYQNRSNNYKGDNTYQNRSSNCDCDSTYQNRSNSYKNDSTYQNRSSNCDCDNTYQNRSNNCDCDSTYQNRSSNCDCDNTYQNRSNNCDCDSTYQNRSNNCGCNSRTPGMVYAQGHDLDNMYCAEKALLRGTLFACLDKPMCNVDCTDDACTTQCQEDKFTIWELRLYLNTNPCDKEALAMLRKLTEKMDEDCGCTFTSDCNRWSWLDGPWPWEYQRCCGKEA